jgi:hypothetical protein
MLYWITKEYNNLERELISSITLIRNADMTLGSICFLHTDSANIWKTTYHSLEQNCLSSWYYFTLPHSIPSITHSSHVSSVQFNVMGGLAFCGQAPIGRNVYTETMGSTPGLWTLSLHDSCCYNVKWNNWSHRQWWQPAYLQVGHNSTTLVCVMNA